MVSQVCAAGFKCGRVVALGGIPAACISVNEYIIWKCIRHRQFCLLQERATCLIVIPNSSTTSSSLWLTPEWDARSFLRAQCWFVGAALRLQFGTILQDSVIQIRQGSWQVQTSAYFPVVFVLIIVAVIAHRGASAYLPEYYLSTLFCSQISTWFS